MTNKLRTITAQPQMATIERIKALALTRKSSSKSTYLRLNVEALRMALDEPLALYTTTDGTQTITIECTANERGTGSARLVIQPAFQAVLKEAGIYFPTLGMVIPDLEKRA